MMSLAIKGDAKINAMLDGLGTKLARSVVRGGMRKLAQVVADEARVRTKSDQVRGAIKVRSSVLANGAITSSVYTSGPGAFIAPWLEWGTAAHFISISDEARPSATDRRGRVRSWSIKQVNKAVKRGSLVIGQNFVGATVSHPGATPHPFLRPAVDAKVGEGVEAMAGYIRARLERHGVNPPEESLDDDE